MFDLLLVSVSFLSFLLAVGELCVKQNTDKNKLLSICLFILSYFLFHSYAMHSDFIHNYKRMLLTTTPLLAILGPISERYLRVLLEESREPIKRLVFKLIPAYITTIIIFPFYFRDLSNDNILHQVGVIHIENIPLYVKFAVFIAGSSVFYFYASTLFRILRTIPLETALKYRNIGIVFFISAFASLTIPILILLIFLINRTTSHYFVSLSIGFFVCSLYLIKQRYPNFFIEFKKEVEIVKQLKNSNIAHLDIKRIQNRLEELLEKEKIYLDEDLSLGDLAEKLNLTSHQLSEYLNKIEQIQFYQLLGKYRVEEAMKNIRNNPKSTFLEIALISGFNSKSSFNQVFKQISGITPSEFKKKLSKSNELGDRMEETM